MLCRTAPTAPSPQSDRASRPSPHRQTRERKVAPLPLLFALQRLQKFVNQLLVNLRRHMQALLRGIYRQLGGVALQLAPRGMADVVNLLLGLGHDAVFVGLQLFAEALFLV